MHFIVLLLLAIAACARSDAEPAARPIAPPLKVPLVLAVEAPTPDPLTLTGELAADQRSELAPDTPGRVTAVLAQLDQRVNVMQTLAKLSIRRPVLATVLILVMIVVGFVGYRTGYSKAMASVIVGGQTLPLLLTLIAIPVIYTWFDDLARFARRIGRTLRRDRLVLDRDAGEVGGHQA